MDEQQPDPAAGSWAVVDESQSRRAKDPDVYLLGAAVGAAVDAAAVRDAMTGLRLPGQRKLQWRAESARRQRLVVTRISSLPVELVAVVYQGSPGERPERRRRKCLERLCFELDQRSVTDLVLESRGPADDERDRVLLHALRAQRVISARLRMTHLPGPADPRLWVADAVCGIVVQDRLGDGSHATAVEPRLRVYVIESS